MGWTEHQRAILGEMGLRLWTAPAEPATVPEPTEAPASPPVATRPIQGDVQPPARTTPLASPAELRSPEPVARRDAGERDEHPASARSPEAGAAPARRTIAVVDASAGQPVPASAVASAGPVAGMGWDALAEAVATCRACALCEGRRQTVFGVGHRQARWMLVGEAPGEQEDLQGEPFVGKAGQLLDNMLRAVGLTRAEAEADRQVYIANVLKCRPPHNRNPEPAEVAQCAPYLQRQIELVQPSLIVAMGRFAVQSLLDTAEPIGRLRGRVHHRQGIPVVVTYHPAYLLRNPLDKARSWEDLCLAQEVWRSVSGADDAA
jgi:DNA polymerase